MKDLPDLFRTNLPSRRRYSSRCGSNGGSRRVSPVFGQGHARRLASVYAPPRKKSRSDALNLTMQRRYPGTRRSSWQTDLPEQGGRLHGAY